LSPEGSGAPEFQVLFSRPATLAGHSDSRTNSFRWIGAGTIHILERGLLVITKRRSPLGFRTADERFVPASEICEVYREGDSVRVDLRSDIQRDAFFQFWTANVSTAGTIVRLLPTTRTIEYEGAAAENGAVPKTQPSLRRVRPRHVGVFIAIIVGLVGIASLVVTDIALRRESADSGHPEPVTPAPGLTVRPHTVTQRQATEEEFASALADMRRFDDRIDGLRAQYRMAFAALQSGALSQQEFVDGIHKWLLPQWQALYSELAANAPADGSLTAVVRKRLIGAAIGWNRGLEEYATGLQERRYESVMAAFDHMSDGNEARREAWRILDRAELGLSPRPDSPAPRSASDR
jgi:hypothetical protein